MSMILRPHRFGLPPAIDPYFANVSLLLHGDGANGSTAFPDSSQYAHAKSSFGNAQVSTAQSKFGGASILLDGSGDYIQYPDHEAFNFGSGDFTVEGWFRELSQGANRQIIGQHTTQSWTTNASFAILSNNGVLTFNYIVGASSTNLANTSAHATNTWHHFAAVRNGGRAFLFLNGVLVASGNVTGSLNNSNKPVTLGALMNDSGVDPTNAYFHGYLDDIRITKGVARYGSFSPPIVAFPNASPADPYFANVSLLLHFDGANGSTTFTDHSQNAHALTVNGNAQISTAQSQFGGASGLFDGNGDFLTRSSHASFDMTNGDFTVECWARFSSPLQQSLLVGYHFALATMNEADIAFNLEYAGGNLRFKFVNNSAGPTTIAAPAPVANTWYHVAAVRSGAALWLFVNGVLQALANIGIQTINAPAARQLNIGRYGLVDTRYMFGHIDDMRVTKGVARYSPHFSVPTEAYPNS